MRVRKRHGGIRVVVAKAFCLAVVSVLVSGCNQNDLATQFPPSATPTNTSDPTLTVTAAPLPSGTSVATETPAPSPSQMDSFDLPDPVVGVSNVREALIQGYRFLLEVARTSSQRARGLMDRTSLSEDAAMLFVYEREERLSFWMKNTLIPLDILFLDSEGVVVDVQTMRTQIGVPDSALEVYQSAHPARYALEMNAGLAEAMGLVPGTQVLFR